MKKTLYILLLIINSWLYSQEYDQFFAGFNNPDYLNLSSVKISNTYIFNSNFNYKINLSDLRFNINNLYSGTAITSNQTIFRDDDNFKILLIYPLFNKIEIGADNEIIISSSSNSNDWNNLFRSKSLIGLNYLYYDSAKISAYIGYENSKQMSKNLNGKLFRFYMSLPEIDLFTSKINANAFSHISNLNENVNSFDLDLNTDLKKNFQLSDYVNINGKYKILNRDYFTRYNQLENKEENLRIEERNDEKLSIDLISKYDLNEYFSMNSSFSFNNRLVERGIRTIQLSDSLPFRVLDESSLNGFISGTYQTESYKQILDFEYSDRRESNDLKINYNLTQDEESELRSFEKLKDNNSVRGKFSSKSFFFINSSDSIKINYSTTILRYDTPSDNNKDDRDEFFSIANFEINHRFSDLLFSGVIFESIQNHLVFLKSERSSANNWNRIFRLSPYLAYNGERLSMHSQFEVLANYTIYDYETINPSIKSFSYRQLSYKDTMFYKIDSKNNIQLKITARLYERGVLYWKEFAESPQNRNIEIFSKMIFFTKPLYNMQIGLGARYFYFEQKNLEDRMPGAINNDFQNKIWGPEAIIITNFNNGNIISFQGWLEFRNYNNLQSVSPNFNINCNIVF